MKISRFLFIMFLFAFSCGQNCPTPDVSNNAITWQGYANEDPILRVDFDKTVSCLKTKFNIDPVRSGYPYVVVLEKPFNIDSYIGLRGCCSFCSGIIYLTFYDGYSFMPNEAVHWLTGTTNETFVGTVLKTCSLN